MNLRNFKLGIVLAGITFAAAPAFAQSPKEGGGAAGGGAAERTGGGGAATSSGGGGGGGGSVATSSGGGGSASSMGGATFSSPSGNAATASNLSFGDRGVREDAPRHRAGFSADSRSAASNGDDGQKAQPRTASGSSGGGERAVPRGTAASGGDSNSGGNGRTRTAPSSEGGANNASGTREVPTWSRPRGDRPTTGTAVERVGPPPDRNSGYRGRYYDPFYYGYGGYGGYGYGNYAYGYFPYSFGMGYGLYSGLGWNPYYGDPLDSYYGGGSGGYSSGIYSTREQGNLKLKVKPRGAKVYVDGYFVGLVDEFDGAFQKLALNSGRHKVEVRAEGFETAEFDVLITPDQTVTFQGDLKRIQ